LFGANPLSAYRTLIGESFGDLQGIGYTLVKATPLLLVGLGTVIAFRSGFFYLGFDGALIVGTTVSVWFALACREGDLVGPLPAVVFFPGVVLLSFAAGGLWAAGVAFAKTRWGGNEVIVSLMLNYVAVLLVNYLVGGPMRQPGDQPQTSHIPGYTRLPFIIANTRAHAGVLVAAACAVLVYLLLRTTRLGYQLTVVGANPRAARYSGINVGRTVIIGAVLAGGLSGLAGAIEVLGVQFRVTEGITSGMGMMGIVAALLGRLHPFGVAIAAVLYAGMGVGAEAMQRYSGVPSSVIYTIQGLIVMLLLIVDVLRYYRLTPARGGRAGAGERALR
jgi:simple sugar transport system permease protein